MNYKDKFDYLPIEEVKGQGSFVKAVCFKPKKAPIICIILGILLMIPNNMYVRLLGAFFILMALAVLKLVKDFKVMDIFDQGIMYYGDREAKSAIFIPFDEIESWNVDHSGGHDLAYKALYSLVREKDLKYIQAKKDSEKPLSIPDALNNIKRSFYKKK